MQLHVQNSAHIIILGVTYTAHLDKQVPSQVIRYYK